MSWEDVKAVLRPEGVHMGIMKIDKEACTKCGLCIQNCPFVAWETDNDEYPVLKDEYECFSCYNCMVVCPSGAMSIEETYRVDSGFWASEPNRIPARMPFNPMDADGNPTEWNPVERAVYERRSVRNFKDDPVPESYIRRVLEAGRFAPSAGNCQPWKFIVITNKALIQEMNESIYGVINGLYNMYLDDEMVKGLEGMAEEGQNPATFDPRLILGGMGSISKKNGEPFLSAPVVILLLGDTRSIAGPQLNIGICGQNMNLVANSLGIKACWVGFSAVIEMNPDLKEKLGIKPPWQIFNSMVLGWPSFKQEGIVPREFNPVTWFRDGSDDPEIEK